MQHRGRLQGGAFGEIEEFEKLNYVSIVKLGKARGADVGIVHRERRVHRQVRNREQKLGHDRVLRVHLRGGVGQDQRLGRDVRV